MMLALALGFLGAVVVVGAFCGGVFLGCWLCGEDGGRLPDGTPAKDVRLSACPGADSRRRKRRKRRTFRDGYAAGYDAGYAAGYDAGFDAGRGRCDAGRGVEQEETMEKKERVQAGEPKPFQAPDTTREVVSAHFREAPERREQDAVVMPERKAPERQEQESVVMPEREAPERQEEEQAREAARQRRRLLDEQAAFRALQHYSAEHAYGLGTTGFRYESLSRRGGLD